MYKYHYNDANASFVEFYWMLNRDIYQDPYADAIQETVHFPSLREDQDKKSLRKEGHNVRVPALYNICIQ